MKSLIVTNGWKTYASSLAGGLVCAAYFLGWIDLETVEVLLGLTLSGAAAGLRHAMPAKK